MRIKDMRFMKNKLKMAFLGTALVFTVCGTGVLQAQLGRRDLNAVVAPPITKQMPVDQKAVELKNPNRGVLSIKRGESGRQLNPSRRTLAEDHKVAQLPDSRLPKTETPATPRAVLKKVVF